jgi:S-adenosylmethionine synthetase
VSISTETFGTSKMSESAIIELIKNNYDLSLGGIIKKLSLYNPIYLKTASYGHFGREDQDFPWERIDNIMGL